jgi:hypothetical protein
MHNDVPEQMLTFYGRDDGDDDQVCLLNQLQGCWVGLAASWRLEGWQQGGSKAGRPPTPTNATRS